MNDKDRERDERIARDAQRRKDERDQRAFDDAAAAEERAGKWSDDVFTEGIEDLFGMSINELQKNARKSDDPEVKRIIADASRLAKKGKQAKALKKVKQNKGKIKKATNKGGCAVVGVMMLGALGGMGWGLYEGAAALIGVA
jgi:hypothetical protein